MSRRLLATDRVLVRMPAWLGDFVMAEPAVWALWRWLREGRIAALGLAGAPRLLGLVEERLPGAQLLPDAAPGRPRPRSHSWRGFEAAVLLSGSFRGAWTAWRAGIPRRIGWARDGRDLLLTDRMSPARELGRVPLGLGRRGKWPRHLPRPFGSTCAELVGLIGVPVPRRRPELQARAEARGRVDRRLAELGLGPAEPFLLANVGARPGSAKGYPPELWARALAALARELDRPQLLVCGPGERDAAEAVASALGNTARPPRCWLEPPPDLAELLALCERAAVVLTADSGPRHLAVAAGAPVAVAMGPGDPRHTADHLGATRVVREPVPCGPCHREACPLPAGEENLACMRRIAPERLADAALELYRYHAPPPERE